MIKIMTVIDNNVLVSAVLPPGGASDRLVVRMNDRHIIVLCDAILGTAVAGNADCIVTGDNDLLTIGRFRGVDIIVPSDFAQYEVERS